MNFRQCARTVKKLFYEKDTRDASTGVSTPGNASAKVSMKFI